MPLLNSSSCLAAGYELVMSKCSEAAARRGPYPASGFVGFYNSLPVTGCLFLECLGERNHGFADLRAAPVKRGEPDQNTLNIGHNCARAVIPIQLSRNNAPRKNEPVYSEHFTPHASARTAAACDFIPFTR